MDKSMTKYLNLSILLSAVFSISAAFTQDFAEPKLPDTPAAMQFKKFLTAIESGDHEKYITENFTDEFLNTFPMSDHLDFFRQVSRMHGGFKVHTILESSEDKLVLIARSKKGRWRKIEITTEASPPYKVAGMGLDMASPPDEVKTSAKRMTEKEILEFVENKLKKMMEADEFSGAVLIAKNGKPLWKKAYGMASKRFSVLNNVDTKFNIGSINKSFTQMAIAQLLEQGKIEFDETIGKYLSDFPEEIAKKVTIRHLLTMKSGMGSYWNDEWQAKWSTIKTVDELIEIIKKIPLDFEPGTSRRYSNSGYVVLGAIIEKVTGQSYYDYVRENIYKPAGMANTDSYELDQIVPNLAIGYMQNQSQNPYNSNKFQNNLLAHSVKGAPAGGGYSTLDDLLKYVEALQKNQLAGTKYTNLVLGLFQNTENPNKRPGGLGIAGGAPVGINAMVKTDFKSGYTVIVLSNYDPPVASDLGRSIFELLMNKKTS
ncbi:beta-lactamase family protein [candidate division KSB1 bacterium]|nr:beta-lactamase family protein [candidate division KSB1 bacterium]